MTSSVGILNRTHDNLEKRIARIESQLGRPRSCKYGTTAERTAYGAPVEGILWWDTTEEVLYVWYDYNWIVAKGVMVGGTAARLATSLPAPGGMWWDTDEENLYVWGVSNSWQTVTGAKFGTREQRDTGGFGGAVWICSDEGYAYAYDDTIDKWRGIGDSVFDLNWLYTRDGDFAIMGNRTNYPANIYDTRRDVHKIGTWEWLSETTSNAYGTAPIIYGQDGLVPYADFRNGGPEYWQTYDGNWNIPCYLHPAGSVPADTGLCTVMVWFRIFEFSDFPQPIIGSYSAFYPPGDWILYVTGDQYGPYVPYAGLGRWATPRKLVWQNLRSGFDVSLDTWHFAAVCIDRFKMDDSDWVDCPPVTTSTGASSGTLSNMVIKRRTTPTSTIYTALCHLHGKISMYYVLGGDFLTEGQIDMFYERTRRLHGV